jgi:uncharacterized protein with FMN-binding domain
MRLRAPAAITMTVAGLFGLSHFQVDKSIRRIGAPVAAPTSGAAPSTTAPHSTSPPTSPPTTGATTTTQPSSSATTRKVAGSTINTFYGPVQVQITLTGSRLTEVTLLQAPSDLFRSQEIAAYAAPILHREALAAQNAQIDAVSGASYTSAGYMQSLQSALDSAR